jgi:hypothetical protein
VTPFSTAARISAIISRLSFAGPKPKLMPMHPSPRAKLPTHCFLVFASTFCSPQGGLIEPFLYLLGSPLTTICALLFDLIIGTRNMGR